MTTTQTDLFEPTRAYRRTNPETSIEAAHDARRFAGNHAAIVADVLRAHPGGLTCEEIVQRCDLELYQVRRRITDVRRHCGAIDSGQRRRNRNGKNCVVWRIPQEG